MRNRDFIFKDRESLSMIGTEKLLTAKGPAGTDPFR